MNMSLLVHMRATSPQQHCELGWALIIILITDEEFEPQRDKVAPFSPHTYKGNNQDLKSGFPDRKVSSPFIML